MAAEKAPSANEYILHHLTFLSNKEPKGIVDFSVINWDTVGFSLALGRIFVGAFYMAARKATVGVPGTFQNIVEWLVEKVDAQVTALDRATRKLSLSIKAREVEEEKKAMAEFGSSDSGASLGDILGAALSRRGEKDDTDEKDEKDEEGAK